MCLNQLLKTMFRSFFVITTGVVVSMYVFCLILNPAAVFTLDDIGRILLMAAAGDLPLILFWSRRELSERQLMGRKAIHLLVLLAILLYFASLWNWVSLKNAGQVTVFLLGVLAVYFMVTAVSIYRDKKLTDQLNRKIKERYHSR